MRNLRIMGWFRPIDQFEECFVNRNVFFLEPVNIQSTAVKISFCLDRKYAINKRLHG